MDDDSSIYVGGLPYDITDETIRTVFNLYGAILDVKVHFFNSISFRVLTNFLYNHLIYVIPFTNNQFHLSGFCFNRQVFSFFLFFRLSTTNAVGGSAIVLLLSRILGQQSTPSTT